VKRQSAQAMFISWRFYFCIFIILFLVAGLIARLLDLTVIKQHFLQVQGDERALRTLSEPAFRGMITDRNGYPLAVSTSVFSIWVSPKEAQINLQQLKLLSKILALQPNVVNTLIQRNKIKKREFVYLKRDMSPELAAKVKALKIPGVYLQQEYRRYYPEGEIAAHVVGSTNVDDRGQEGMELAYNDWLAGSPGKRKVIKDRLGRIISDVQTLQEQKAGHDLVLSINRRLQYLAYRELMAGVKANNAESGSVVVLDTKTGEILAMVNQPSYNPNNHRNKHNQDSYRNRAVTDVFEPGSTIKAFSVATALDSGQYQAESVVDTAPGWMSVGGHLVRDEHNNGLLTVTEILQLSSNIGVTKMLLSLPPDHLWHLLHDVGFGEVTSIGFPGERAGLLINRPQWSPFILATLGFGYGISVTTLQLAQAYSVIANNGIKIPLSLTRIENPPAGERVMNEKVAKEMLKLLEAVVMKKGHGGNAHILGYHVAGKTGTARIVGPNGYEKHRYVASFVGIAPVSNPRIVVAVVIRDPRGKQYYGNDVSAPVFAKIMEGALRNMNIPPDDTAGV
jgi:cell division protein FtsI (penicillin-binding protein 3)